MRQILLALIFSTSCFASNIEDPQVNNLVIGTGTFPNLHGQRQTSNTTEFSIDINPRVRPTLVANGLDPITYIPFLDNRFEFISFEHVSFCPYERANMLTAEGKHRDISSGIYEAKAWIDSTLNPRLGLPVQLFRILKPGGTLIFCSPVLQDQTDFSRMCLNNDENGLQSGLQAWKDVCESVGFSEILFSLKWHAYLEGWYVEMTASKPQPLKRNRTAPAPALERQATQELFRTNSLLN